MATKLKKFMIVDGNALVHRGFHAIPHLSTKKGEPTNGVYGFALLFLKALKELAPDYVAVTFDRPEPTFRDKLFEKYKATRVKAPDELYQQIPRVKELVRAFNVPVYEMPGYEADDLIGSLAAMAEQKPDLEVVILTGDLDTLQLVDQKIKVFAPKQGLSETKLYDDKAIVERYGLKPEQMLDYKALRGDPSDNIPGVKGVGEKTAVELLQKFGTLEKIYEYLAAGAGKDRAIRPRVAELLTTHKSDADLSKKLAKIVTDLKVNIDWDQARLAAYDQSKVHKLFQELEFRSLLDKLPKAGPSAISALRRADHDYRLVDSPEKLEKFLALLEKQKSFAVDTETTSLNPLDAALVGVGFSWKAGEAWYVPKRLVNAQLKKYLARSGPLKTGHNLKYDYLILKRVGAQLGNEFFDTMIAAYLLNPGARNFDLDSLSFNFFGFQKTPITDLIGEGKNQISMAEVPIEKVAAYCGEDADFTWRLKEKLEKELQAKKLYKIFQNIEMPLIRVLAQMEEIGIKVDPKVLGDLSKEADKEIAALEKKIWRLAGQEFNIGSPVQLKEVLFEKLEIPSDELKKGKTGLSTAAAELEKLRGLHPIVDLISDWRELTKLKNTYLDALPELINPKTGRVHTSYNQTVAATGRLSSSDPNLQNIPIRTELGRQVRTAFVAAKGYQLVAIDYSQIELRLAAHLSGDKKMISIFEEGGDIHSATAREIFGVKPGEAVTPEMRRDAKTINFGVLYGLSAYGLKTRIAGVSQGQAQDFIDRYFASYEGLTSYLEGIILQTRRQGFVKNEIGRIRNLPEINSSQFQVRSAAERAAINMPLQSLAADIIKMAMNKLAADGLTSREDCRLLLQVHDELVFEIETKQVAKYVPQIAKIMSEIYKLKVPLTVDVKAGDNWGEQQKLLL